MCGIIGIINPTREYLQNLPAALSLLEHRGKDGCGIADGLAIVHEQSKERFLQHITQLSKQNQSPPPFVLLHYRHAIVDDVAQPLGTVGTRNNVPNTVFIYNGEIYNWERLNKKYQFHAKNDADLFFQLWMKNKKACLPELNGVYAFASVTDNEVILCRDFFGERPLVYTIQDGVLSFASEGKALHALGIKNPITLHPREILYYNRITRQWRIEQKERFALPQESTQSKEQILQELSEKIIESVRIRTEGLGRFGILFSGGIDSTLLAWICKKLNRTFVCYTVGYQDAGVSMPQDLLWAQRVADECKFPRTLIKIGDVELKQALPRVTKAIETTDVIKVGVATPFFIAGQHAKQDGVSVMLSGLGSEELFAGYERHAKAAAKAETTMGDSVNEECLRGLLAMHDRDLYRDDLIMMANTLELRLPFLDRNLIEYALSIPSRYKISSEQKKIILREAAEQLGLPAEFCWRKKMAAQYGSGVDKALQRMAKKAGVKTKKEYLELVARD